MKVSFEGIGELVLTFPIETEVGLGDFVELTAQGAVKPATVNSEPIGICVSRWGKFVGIQVRGGCKAMSDGTLIPGFHCVKVLEGNQLAKAESGVPRLILTTDPLKKQVEVLF